MANGKNDEMPLNAASGYLSYLPACLADADAAGAPPFIAAYLKAFEKLLSGIADGDELEGAGLDALVAYRAGIRDLLDAGVMGELFYPRWSFLFEGEAFAKEATLFMPPLSSADDTDKATLFNLLATYFGLPQYEDLEGSLSPVERWARTFFEWLGATIGLDVDKNWPIDASREIIGKTFAFDRARGTSMGMEWLINAYLTANPSPVDGVTFTKATVGDCVQPALIVRDTDSIEQPAFHLFNAYPGPENVVILSNDVRPAIERDGITFTVDDSTLMAHVPARFEIDVTLSIGEGVAISDEKAAVQGYYRLMRTILDAVKPALTTYVVRIALEQQST
ncbi:hypothetical protein [Trinickia acidisoli]|uniref:hypothetical protein n=1 Tax=Trinickia acidisoli TaxID=2767482 RepID=UPI001A8DBB2D|nr:hypothetical protein [Trinickia acidisoli]